MGVRDRSMDWLRTEYWIGTERFNGVLASGSGGLLVSINDIPSTNTDTGIGLEEIQQFGLAGFAIRAGDERNVACLDLQLPRLINPDEEVGVRVVYTTNEITATTDAVQWAVVYDQIDFGETLTAPATELNTVLVAETADQVAMAPLKRTARGVVNAGVFDWTSRQGAITWQVACADQGTYNNEKLVFLGLLFDYYPKLCIDGNEDLEAYQNLGKA